MLVDIYIGGDMEKKIVFMRSFTSFRMRLWHFSIVSFLVLLAGCAEMTPPHPVDILTHPLGKGFLKAGMDKKEVLSQWGEPDEVVKGEVDKFGLPNEKWIYQARIKDVPIGVGYLTKSYFLYFEGDALIRFREEK